MDSNQYRIIKIISLVCALSIGAGISYYYVSSKKSAQQQQHVSYDIVPFDDARDMQEVLNIFEKDRYWLLASDDYDPEYAFRTRSPNMKEDQYTGQMKIKILREGDHFVGLITYYLKSLLEGTILFLAVKEEYRGKRYAEKLLQYAFKELKQMGSAFVTLVTRTTNVRAQSVYTRTGFIETGRSKGFVYYAKPL